MAEKKPHKKRKHGKLGERSSFRELLALYTQLADLKRESEELNHAGKRTEERLADIEVHLNLLARLLTTLCIEKMGFRAGALRQLVLRIEKEALRDSQIMELESLYKLSGEIPKKAKHDPAKSKKDPWDQIS